jgi:predicted O-methyltransferase YrrM
VSSPTRRRAKVLLAATRSDPMLVLDYVRFLRGGRKHAPKRSRQALPGMLDVEAGLALLRERVGPWEPGAELRVLTERRLDEAARRGGGANMAGDSALGLLAYAVVRAARPDAVIETGVATGVTSAHILAALADNGHGHLHSIDLPPTDMIEGGTVGIAIPERLKARWTYHWGSATRLLPRVLRETSGPRVFIHDSDHSYEHMRWELETAWGALAPGDVIVADDVDFHTAFVDVARSMQSEPHLIAQAEKAGTSGLMFRH